ncbi:MAG: chorismate mutase [Patescibacteria group bacterium]|nr:chorismate mutase [Patescibacteria group bacterium]
MNKTLEELRKEIDAIDANIVEMLGKRMEIVKEIGKIKKEMQKEIFDDNRWQQVLINIKEKATAVHLDTSFIENLYSLIHKHAQELEKKE